jgi:hypothetical protein
VVAQRMRCRGGARRLLRRVRLCGIIAGRTSVRRRPSRAAAKATGAGAVDSLSTCSACLLLPFLWRHCLSRRATVKKERKRKKEKKRNARLVRMGGGRTARCRTFRDSRRWLRATVHRMLAVVAQRMRCRGARRLRRVRLSVIIGGRQCGVACDGGRVGQRRKRPAVDSFSTCLTKVQSLSL